MFYNIFLNCQLSFWLNIRIYENGHLSKGLYFVFRCQLHYFSPLFSRDWNVQRGERDKGEKE